MHKASRRSEVPISQRELFCWETISATGRASGTDTTIGRGRRSLGNKAHQQPTSTHRHCQDGLVRRGGGGATFITSNIDLDLSPPLSLSSLERFDPTQLKARVHCTLCTPPACPPAWLPSANLPADISPFLFIFHHRRARLRTWP